MKSGTYMKFNWNDYYVMSYIGFNHRKSNVSFDDAKGFLDFYFRVVLTEDEFNSSIDILVYNGFVNRDGKYFKPTARAKELRRQYKSIRDYFSLIFHTDSERRFAEAFMNIEISK